LLFKEVDFISHAGVPLSWKLECEALSIAEWSCLAKMILEYEKRPFSIAMGIPRGGVLLANALDRYGTNKAKDPILVVDDVYTTGTSFREYCEDLFPDRDVIKWCVFARKPTTDGVKALFTMPDIEDI
jgi:hypothetical protein